MDRRSFLPTAVLAMSAAGLPADAAQFFVSPKGNDAGPGTLRRPFATLEKARDAARAAAKPVTVLLRGGVYTAAKTLEFGAADSGVEYRAYGNEKARLIGGRILRGFKPSPGRPHVLECDLRALGITDFGSMKQRGFGRRATPAHMELFFQGRRMTVARWPNEGFEKIASIGGAPRDDGHGKPLGNWQDGFHYDGDRPARWKNLDDVWVHGYWAWDWADSYEQVGSIDLKERLIRMRAPDGYEGFRAGQRYYYVNILEELDSPGEYYVDRAAGKLYFWPPAPIGSGEAAVSMLETPLIRVNGASRMALRGLTLEYARAGGIEMSGGDHNSVEDCVVRNVGNTALSVRGGEAHGVARCEIYQTGDAGIVISGGDRATLKPGGHEVTDNHIHHIAQWSKTYQPAVSVSGVGNRIAHNLIHDGPHAGILFSGNEQALEFNEVHHMALETGDVGAFYIGRDWTQRGNTVRHNFIHHMGGVGMGSMGVYLDDCTSGATVFGNVFYKVQRAAFVGGGRDNTLENNIFVECEPAVAIDGRGLDPRPVWHNMVYQTMKRGLERMNYTRPPYSERYPGLAAVGKYYERDAGVPPEGNRVLRNICVGGKWLNIAWLADSKIIDVADNLTSEDPLFVDAAKMNFQLRETSPAYKLGFQKIPFEQIGPRKPARGADR